MAFQLTGKQVLGSDSAILLGVKEYSEWKDGVKGERQGTAYSVLALGGDDPCIVSVKVPDDAPLVTQAVLEVQNAKRDFIELTFTGFTARTYMDKAGKMALSCKADRAELTVDID